MKQQSTTNQRGEIEFRKKLVAQQVEQEAYLENEYDIGEIENVLQERMDQTHEDMNQLVAQGVTLAPFIELGAERGQRGLVIENDLENHGAAIDISLDTLKSCQYYATLFDKPIMPLRVCCDANLLPFKSNSVSLVFCYSVLHHFPDPTPIIMEGWRVLTPGGHVYFEEEPYKKVLHIPLYKRNVHRHVSGNKLRRMMDHFFSEKTGNEEEHNIVSNQHISLGDWRKTFERFENHDITLHSWLREVKSQLYQPDNPLGYLWSYLTGGIISGTAQKPGTPMSPAKSIEDALICPSCLENNQEIAIRKQSEDDMFVCSTCYTQYPVIEGVAMLFTSAKLAELYPEYSPASAIS